VFGRLLAQQIDQAVLCRNHEDPEWQPASKRFRVIGKYGILKELGEGAFGKVHLAFDASRAIEGKIGRLVALKSPVSSMLVLFAEAAGRRPDPHLSDSQNQEQAKQWAKLR